MAKLTQLYAEDMAIGFRFKGEPIVLTQQLFNLFSQVTGDKHPIHNDEDYAAKTKFGRPVAHGLMLASLTALGATKLSDQLRDSMVALINTAFIFRRPAFVGDTVTVEFECKAVTETKTANTSKVELQIRLYNQSDTALVEGFHTYLLKTSSA
jgi:3-hydroxybutyryl-CoA dehydratase